MRNYLERFAGALLAFFAGLGFQVSGFEEFRVALGLWAFAGLWGVVALLPALRALWSIGHRRALHLEVECPGSGWSSNGREVHYQVGDVTITNKTARDVYLRFMMHCKTDDNRETNVEAADSCVESFMTATVSTSSAQHFEVPRERHPFHLNNDTLLRNGESVRGHLEFVIPLPSGANSVHSQRITATDILSKRCLTIYESAFGAHSQSCVPKPEIIALTEPGPQRNTDWLINIDREEWWDCGPRGLVAAIHVAVENLSATTPMVLSEFEVQSGAVDWHMSHYASDSDHALREPDIERAMEGKTDLTSVTVDPGRRIDGWIAVALLKRFVGGRPGYILVPKENPHNWRGYERPPTEPSPGTDCQRGEAPQIATELSTLMDSSSWILDEVKNIEAMYERDPEHWDSNLGGRESALAQLFKSQSEKYVSWGQSVTAYLRDRVGLAYARRLSAAGEWGTVEQRLERHREVLDQFISEFRAIATA